MPESGKNKENFDFRLTIYDCVFEILRFHLRGGYGGQVVQNE